MLDPCRHPFREFSERILFPARRGSETVGRIEGIIDRHYNQFHGEKWAFGDSSSALTTRRAELVED